MDKMFHEAALPAAKNSAGFIGNHRKLLMLILCLPIHTNRSNKALTRHF
jgi:hypothetical protein